jgi:hypothetical protein
MRVRCCEGSRSKSRGSRRDTLLTSRCRPDNLVYFQVTDMTYDPLVPLEQDFASSVSSKARGGELGCWIEVERTRMISLGVQRGLGISGSKKWWGTGESEAAGR